ncbi:MAG: TIM-barrel domain-containing protein [Chitinophagaceae bacterium]
MKYRLLLLLTCFIQISRAQDIGSYRSGFQKKGNEYSFTTSNGIMKIEFCTPDMFRVRTTWNKQFEENEPWMVVKYNWAPVTVTSSETKDFFLLSTSSLKIKIFKSPLRLEVRDAQGKLLSSETNAGASKRGDTVACVKSMAADEHFFGFGERMDFLDRRHKKLRLNVGRGKGMPHIIGAYNVLEANYSPVPFFMSTNGYGIFFHNAFPTEWDMGAANKKAYSFSAEGGELDYYFMYGPKFANILNSYITLTGSAPLMPDFAYGLHIGTYSGGTWGYEQFTSDAYVIALARKLREMGIPVDILWLDSTWRIFGTSGGKGATTFEWRETFKDPRAMFDSLYAMNFKMAGLHLRPRFDNGQKIKLLDTARRLGFTYPEAGSPGEFVNFFDSAAVDFWWASGVKRVASQGAKFLKTDEGSAFGGLANESDKIGPTGKDIPKLHNLFPLAYAKAPYEKFQQFNGIRGMNQTREGYAGIQRYPYIFAGDWPSEWQYFGPVITAGLNIGISGVGNWAHCMGGFEHTADPELYVRWVQMGMFSPVALVFGMDHPGYKEPWNYGEDGLRNFKRYDSLRYRLFPYIYSNAYKMNQTGMPLMKALVLDWQDDENVYNITDQYMFGDALMVCPVITKGASTRTVYLPAGEWYDYWTGKKYTGSRHVNVVSPLDTMPIFAKAGAIIPMQPGMKYMGEKKIDEITLDIFPGPATSFDLYEDDGTSLAYQQGAYSITKISSSMNAQAFTLNIMRPEGKFRSPSHYYSLKIHLPFEPAQITENGSAVRRSATAKYQKGEWHYDATNQLLYIKTNAQNERDIKILLTR